MTRNDFLTLTFTLVGAGFVATACSSSSSPSDGGTGGATGSGGAGGSGNAACSDPLSETQEADSTGHVHSVSIAAASLNQTADQTFATAPAGTPAHSHMITLTAAQLATLKGGGSVTGIVSTNVSGHVHTYDVSCH